MTMIGIISLAGIVVNNAIVLIDYINLTIIRKRRELELEETDKLTPALLVECVVEAGRTRLRPVLLTAITTILGLLPLALGININFRTLTHRTESQLLYWWRKRCFLGANGLGNYLWINVCYLFNLGRRAYLILFN